VLRSAADPVAIDADDVALRHLCKHLRGRHEHRPAGHHVERLGRRVSMVEVHLVRLELRSAVGAWDAPQVSQEFDHACLPDPNSLELESTIPAVVLDVVRPLAQSDAHGQD
jgi:hypothetical protein